MPLSSNSKKKGRPRGSRCRARRYWTGSNKSIPFGRVFRLADRLAALGARPSQCPVGPTPGFRLPALEPGVMALGPHAGLQDQREADPSDDDPARPGDDADQRRKNEEGNTQREEGPFHDRVVEEVAQVHAY